jgi:hypothetical protein
MLAAKKEVERAISNLKQGPQSSDNLNRSLAEYLTSLGWTSQPRVLSGAAPRAFRLDFQKSRVGMEVQFGHSSFIGIDLLKLHLASYAGTIDAGIYVTVTRDQQHAFVAAGHTSWQGRWSLFAMAGPP